MTRHSFPSRMAALACWGVALVMVERLTRTDSSSAVLLVGVVLTAACWSAAAMWRRNSFGSHLVAALTVLAVGGGTLLELTVGLPGQPVAPLTPGRTVLLGLVVLVGVLLTADARLRRVTSVALRSPPYAL